MKKRHEMIICYDYKRLENLKIQRKQDVTLMLEDSQHLGFEELIMINTVYVKCKNMKSKLTIIGCPLQKIQFEQINHSKLKIDFEVE